MKTILAIFYAVLLTGCVTTPLPPPKWNPANSAAEAEYEPYLVKGTASLYGQAFLTQRCGRVITAAGRTVTLDPATTIGVEWWNKAGRLWRQRGVIPPSPKFSEARRTTVADSEGRFKFATLPSGKYYVLTTVTWEIPMEYFSRTEGGMIGQLLDINDGENSEVVLNRFAQ